MVVFPNCKINIGLQVLHKRADGFHDIETVFYPVAVRDALECIPVAGQQQDIAFGSSGNTIAGDPGDNLCIRAFRLLKKDHPFLPNVAMHLLKHIPSGAGLGGGSADAAFTLQLLNKQFELGITEAQLLEYALQLGSDCPYFIKNEPAYATGRGEKLATIQLDLTAYKICIVNPGIHINTGWAFSQLNSTRSRTDLREAIRKPVPEWKDTIINHFEMPVFAAFPEIGTIRRTLYEAGAHYAAMSGSGSSVYGIFDRQFNAEIDFPVHYFSTFV